MIVAAADLLENIRVHTTAFHTLDLSFGFWRGYRLNDLHESQGSRLYPGLYGPLEQVLLQQEYLGIEALVLTCPGGINESFWDSAFMRMLPDLWERRKPKDIIVQYGECRLLYEESRTGVLNQVCRRGLRHHHGKCISEDSSYPSWYLRCR